MILISLDNKNLNIRVLGKTCCHNQICSNTPDNNEVIHKLEVCKGSMLSHRIPVVNRLILVKDDQTKNKQCGVEKVL